MMRSTCGRIGLHDLGLALVLVLVTSGIASLYVSRERTFYHWDFGRSQHMTTAKAAEFREWPSGAVDSLWRSFSADYNELFTAPILPFVLLLGDSRLVFVVSMALVYQVPFILAIGAIAVKMVPLPSRLVFWSAAAVALSTPQVWVPTLRGFPEMGAAFLIAVAIVLFLQNMALTHWWQVVLIGLCVATAMLLRRAFAYSGVAFFVTITLFTLLRFGAQARNDFRSAWLHLVRVMTRIVLTAAVSLMTLATVAWPFLYNLLTRDYGSAYAYAYNPPPESFGYYVGTFGWGVWALTVLGLSFGVVVRTLSRPVTQVIVLFGTYSLAQWVLVVGYAAPHYTPPFTMFVVLGLTAALWTVWSLTRGWGRMLALTALVSFLTLNAVIGLAPVAFLRQSPVAWLFPKNRAPLILSDEQYVGVPIASVLGRQPARSLFSENHAPLVREDYDEIRRLVDYLRSVAASREPIYVASSSVYVNEDLIRHAERAIHGNARSTLNFLQTQHVDALDSYPLAALLEAQYVIVPTPWQTHLRMGEQDLIRVVGVAFADKWEITRDFEPLSVEFRFANGAIARIYKRAHATSWATVLKTFEAMREFVGPRPGGQLDWITLNEASKYSIDEQDVNTYSLRTQLHDFESARSTWFLYAGLVAAPTVVRGSVTLDGQRCHRVDVSVASLTPAGEIIGTANASRFPHQPREFALVVPVPTRRYLLFAMEGHQVRGESRSCRVAIDNLSVSGQLSLTE